MPTRNSKERCCGTYDADEAAAKTSRRAQLGEGDEPALIICSAMPGRRDDIIIDGRCAAEAAHDGWQSLPESAQRQRFSLDARLPVPSSNMAQ